MDNHLECQANSSTKLQNIASNTYAPHGIDMKETQHGIRGRRGDCGNIIYSIALSLAISCAKDSLSSKPSSVSMSKWYQKLQRTKKAV